MTNEEKAAVDRTWEELNPDWLEMGDLTGCFAKSQFDDCPGCGRFEQLQVRDVSQDEQCVTVSCDECHFCSWGETPSEAIENWNRRASLAALESATARAEEISDLRARLVAEMKSAFQANPTMKMEDAMWNTAIAKCIEIVRGESKES